MAANTPSLSLKYVFSAPHQAFREASKWNLAFSFLSIFPSFHDQSFHDSRRHPSEVLFISIMFFSNMKDIKDIKGPFTYFCILTRAIQGKCHDLHLRMLKVWEWAAWSTRCMPLCWPARIHPCCGSIHAVCNNCPSGLPGRQPLFHLWNALFKWVLLPADLWI